MPEQARSAGRPNEHSERLERLVSLCATMCVFLCNPEWHNGNEPLN